MSDLDLTDHFVGHYQNLEVKCHELEAKVQRLAEGSDSVAEKGRAELDALRNQRDDIRRRLDESEITLANLKQQGDSYRIEAEQKRNHAEADRGESEQRRINAEARLAEARMTIQGLQGQITALEIVARESKPPVTGPNEPDGWLLSKLAIAEEKIRKLQTENNLLRDELDELS